MGNAVLYVKVQLLFVPNLYRYLQKQAAIFFTKQILSHELFEHLHGDLA